MIEIHSTSIPEVKVMTSSRAIDGRGFFAETYSRRDFIEIGITADFVQDNESWNSAAGTIRGLHFQRPDFAQAKLVRVLSGAILDVAVDIRVGSPTYAQHVALELDAADNKQIFIPRGFAHGFCTLAPATHVTYKVDAYYSEAHESGLLWNDPNLAIKWPVDSAAAILSEKDADLPGFAAFESPFMFEAA
ncbi:dTDP-4-dehydrorhamnose 3,5-epimerase [Parvibaculum lavamentivorans DS-1]|uniref:dTDP-4-dehydrorhamnose 3,5-epimerase n=1 Tax=Parvibaculum lavamentivorans (strain DS-1 / DSM 13023 / NCIMB 13966) TaxID=402881 RepID=A7HYC7_PARL1|nr:dTDP-4-dehydrorhamnose 3,5-epimerase [Parvibaculum lavamentivorans]ABS64910.1 dTDP-4-dehydrorhamnose 3,5-epimerase [Parvibaculum lavamentivorans DS-1]